MVEQLKKFLQAMITHNGSDLHLKSGAIPRARIDGKLVKLGQVALSPAHVDSIAKEILSKEQIQNLHHNKSLDFTYVLDDVHRFRVNFFFQMDGLSAVFRLIPTEIPEFEKLGLPDVVKEFTQVQRGLVLVTGVTGSGKSTTLASLIDIINCTQAKHIVTIEDPIEFVHKDKKSLINQRSVGQDTHSFSDALRAALREDPDIILVGEMRDLETIEIALHAANTGHLVFSTLHTLDAKETISRVVGMFEKEEQNRIRMALASVLEGVISLRLIPKKTGGRVPVVEVLKKTSRIEQLIMESRDFEIPDALAEGKEVYGTQLFDQALLDLLKAGKIDSETALDYATNPADLKLKMSGVGEDAIISSGSHEPSVFSLKDND